MKSKLLIFVLIIALIFELQFTYTQKPYGPKGKIIGKTDPDGKGKTFVTDKLIVDIKGGGPNRDQLPEFFIQQKEKLHNASSIEMNTEQNNFKFKLKSVHQSKTNETLHSPIGGTLISLNSLKWNFKEPVVSSTGISFSIKSNATNSVPSFEFLIKISEENAESLKFDFIVDELPVNFWNNQANYLVIKYGVYKRQKGKVGGKPKPDEKPSKEKNEKKDKKQKLTFDEESYFQVQDTSDQIKNNVKVEKKVIAQARLEGVKQRIYVGYEKFETKLVHDPTIGVIISGSIINKYSITLVSILFVLYQLF